MGVSKDKIYSLIDYLDSLWKERERIAIDIVQSGFRHEDIEVKQIDLKPDISLENDNHRIEFLCAYHALTKYKIERINRIIRPIGSVRKPNYSASGCLISQFRWDEKGTPRSKNFKPELYEIVSLAVSRGDTTKQILKLIDNGGDRANALGDSRHWVLVWESELIELGLID